VYVTVHVPVPLVIVIVFPLREHAPDAATATASPDEAVAETVKDWAKSAVNGACCVTVIV
jgi:hypothetical protein